MVLGIDIGAVISSGGTQFDDGTASGGTTLKAGIQIVGAGAVASGMTVLSGGTQYVSAGGSTTGTLLSGGREQVLGAASGTVVGNGGSEYVSSGGIVSGASISGGTLELASGAVDGSAPLSFTGSGGLILDASVQFGGLVAGFGSASLSDTIDFRDIPFVASGGTATTVSWTQLTSGANASGTLTVSEGGHTANITLLGQYVAGNFTSSTDGHGGTLVTDPPVVANTDPNPLTLVHGQQ